MNFLFIVLLISKAIINVPYYLFISFYLAWHWFSNKVIGSMAQHGDIINSFTEA